MKITIKPKRALAGLALAIGMFNAQAAETRCRRNGRIPTRCCNWPPLSAPLRL